MEVNKLLKPIFIEGLLKVSSWYKSDNPHYLRSIFDQIGFKDRDENQDLYFTLPASLSSKIGYPGKGDKESLKKAKEDVLWEINKKYESFAYDYLNSLFLNQLFFLLEKFGGNVPFDDLGITSVFDAYKIKAAKNIIQANRENLGHKDNLFINIDLSGIQRFIYNISSEGALKNLRSRSFFIELLCNHITYRVLDVFNLHYVNVLMNGGGSIYILSSCPGDYENKLTEISYSLNRWLLKEFNGVLYAAFGYVPCSDKRLENDLSKILEELSIKTFDEKQKKFKAIISKGEFPFIEEEDPKYQGCEVCYKDDSGTKFYRVTEGEERFRCSNCNRLVKIGNQIPKTRFIYKYDRDVPECLQIEDSYYLLAPDEKPGWRCLWVIYEDSERFVDSLKGTAIHILAKTYTKRNKELPDEVYREIVKERNSLEALLSLEKDNSSLKDAVEALKDENTATLEYIAESSEGAKLIGALRMDADNIGEILHDGFYGKITLEGLSSFSRNLNYFFKLHLESLCREGYEREDKNNIFKVKGDKGRNVHVIYTGGDDLFVLGAWSDTASLAMDIGRAFKKYTCDNIDIGVSGGLTLHNPKFPVNKMADESMRALKVSKGNLGPCWMCRRDWINCPLYDLGRCMRKDSISLFLTSYMALRKKELDEKQNVPKYSQEPSRLKLALKWKSYDTEARKVIDEVDEYLIKPLRSFQQGRDKISRVFFHNVLFLLNVWYDEGMIYIPKVVWMLDKFKNDLKTLKIDIEDGESLYDLYEMYLHFHDSKRFSTLHIPLSWNILLMKGVKSNES